MLSRSLLFVSIAFLFLACSKSTENRVGQVFDNANDAIGSVGEEGKLWGNPAYEKDEENAKKP